MKKIKSIKTKITGKLDDQNGYINSEIIYNSEGNVLEETHFNGPGQIESRVVYNYDPQGRLIEETNYMENNELTEQYRYTRNEQGKTIKTEILYGDGSKSIRLIERTPSTEDITTYDEDNAVEARETRKFDSTGKLISKTIVNDSGETEENVQFEYDDKDNLIQKTELDEDDEPEAISKYFYNEKNNPVRIVTLNPAGQHIDEIKISYDENGRVTEQIFGTRFIIKNEYNDEEKTRIENRYMFSGELDHQTIYKYNDDGTIAEEENVFNTLTYIYEHFE